MDMPNRLPDFIVDWRTIFCSLELGPDSIVRAIEELCNGQPCLLLGRKDIAKKLAALENSQEIVADYQLELPTDLLETIEGFPKSGFHVVMICEHDRTNASILREAVMGKCTRIIDADDLLTSLGPHLPDGAWNPVYPHIYPLDIPTIDIADNLDALIIDAPARSIAQLPIGFSYVYKALKKGNLALQAMDLDIVAYHRYHQRRCLNQWPCIVQDEHRHPEDPWQAASYLFWTDPKTIDYFSELLDEIALAIAKAKPRVVGFSLHQTSEKFIGAIVSRLDQLSPGLLIVVGGMSCYQSNVAGKVFPRADYVVVGEAESIALPLFQALASGKRPRNLPGVISKFDTPDWEFIGAPLPHNMDHLGAPDYGYTNLRLYRNWNGYTLVPIIATRGCGWSRCTFCAERFNWRARTPELIADEIEEFYHRGFRQFVFNDSDFNSNHELVIRLCNSLVERKLDIQLTAQLRISKHSDAEYFTLLRRAGFSCLRFGVDGFTDHTLRLQKKGYTLATVRQNLRDCHAAGIFIEVNAVIGVPGETEEDIDQSADFLIENKDYIGRVAYINPLMLFVSSVYYNEPEKFGIKFYEPKEELYAKHTVTLPNDAWYSEAPFIDYDIRRSRMKRLVSRLYDGSVALGDFAKFTVRAHSGEEEGNTANNDSAQSGPIPSAVRLWMGKLLADLNGAVKSLYIYGGGEHTRWMLFQSQLKPTHVAAIFDRNAALQRDSLFGIPVLPPEAAFDVKPKHIVISSPKYENEIYAFLQPLESTGTQIHRLYLNKVK